VRTAQGLTPHNQIGQLNTLLQLEHLRTYPFIRAAEESGRLTLHAWWFDIAGADVYEWRHGPGSFVLVNDESVGPDRPPA
jgi:carbonic anhydrase